MEEDLPKEFDVIVLGTGMPESVLAAAAARSGKSVLHLDQSDYYGADWGSFNFDRLQEWVTSTNDKKPNDELSTEDFSSFLREEELLLLLPPKLRTTFNVNVHEFVPQQSASSECESIKDSTAKSEGCYIEVVTELSATDKQMSLVKDGEISSESEMPVDTAVKNIEPKITLETENKPKQRQWTINELHKHSRKFNLDLAPKLLFSRGALVELLIQSNISRYAEFQCSSQILTLLDGNLMPVPCSRADVFSTKHVSIVEKRMLMKLLKFCLDFEEHPEEFKEYESKPFIKFLSSKKLTRNVEHYLIHSIAMVNPDHPTLDSLKRVQKFLQSLGRYGNSPFLFPLYGSGEMPQCFCRLCAVFGGVYCLKRRIDALILNNARECVAVVINKNRINCKFIVMECGYFPKEYIPKTFRDKSFSKAIFITDGPLYKSEHDKLTFLRLPVCNGIENATNVLELGPSSNVCPDGLRVVYMNCISSKQCAEDDLLPAATMLFNMSKDGEPKTDLQDVMTKPNVIWNMYLNQYDNSWLELNDSVPKNVFLLPTPDIEQDYEDAIGKAKDVFVNIFPSEEFLPRAPEPEEIIMDSDETEKTLETAENSNVDDVNNEENVVASTEALTLESNNSTNSSSVDKEAAETKPADNVCDQKTSDESV